MTLGIDHSLPDLHFECPRCKKSIEERLYGPCGACRETLKSEQVRTGPEVEVPEYEPKMNVTPNAVALKED